MDLLLEDIYDRITNKLVHDIVTFVKYQKEGDFNLPEDISDGDFYDFENFPSQFDIELYLRESSDIGGVDVDADYYPESSTIVIKILLNPKRGNKILQKLVYELNEIIRHELEHMKQDIEGYEFPKNPRSSEKYYSQQHELEALRKGFLKRAKKENKGFETTVRNWFKNNRHKYKMKPIQQERVIQKILGKSS